MCRINVWCIHRDCIDSTHSRRAVYSKDAGNGVSALLNGTGANEWCVFMFSLALVRLGESLSSGSSVPSEQRTVGMLYSSRRCGAESVRTYMKHKEGNGSNTTKNRSSTVWRNALCLTGHDLCTIQSDVYLRFQGQMSSWEL